MNLTTAAGAIKFAGARKRRNIISVQFMNYFTALSLLNCHLAPLFNYVYFEGLLGLL